MSETFNINQILAVLPGLQGEPAGTADESALKAAIVQQREYDRRQIYSGDPLDVGLLDWHAKVIDPARLTLTDQQSNQTRVLTWLLEGLLRQFGWRGFIIGLDLFGQMLQAFPDSLRPAPQPDTSRAGRYSALLQTGDVSVNLKLPCLPFDRVSMFDVRWRSISLEDFSPEIRGSRTSPTEEEIRQVMEKVTKTDREKWVADAELAIAQLDKFVQIVKSDLQRDTGTVAANVAADVAGIMTWRNKIERRIRAAVTLYEEKFSLVPALELENSDAKTDKTTSGEIVEPAVASRSGMVGETPQSRAQVLAELNAAAIYFESVDPHSIVSHHIRRAEKWMHMPLDAILVELVGDTHEIFRILPGGLPFLPPATLESTSQASPELSDEQGASPQVELDEKGKNTPENYGFKVSPAVTRTDALKRVNASLNYLARFEPHSFAKFPLSFAVEVANIPIDKIINQAVTDETVRLELFKRLGVNFLKTAK